MGKPATPTRAPMSASPVAASCCEYCGHLGNAPHWCTPPLTIVSSRQEQCVEERAIRFLLDRRYGCIPLGGQILERAVQHLQDRLEAELFGPRPHLQAEQQAMAYIKGLGAELQHASDALFQAAERLKAAGKVLPANETFKAHLYFRDKAKEILG